MLAAVYPAPLALDVPAGAGAGAGRAGRLNPPDTEVLLWAGETPALMEMFPAIMSS